MTRGRGWDCQYLKAKFRVEHHFNNGSANNYSTRIGDVSKTNVVFWFLSWMRTIILAPSRLQAWGRRSGSIEDPCHSSFTVPDSPGIVQLMGNGVCRFVPPPELDLLFAHGSIQFEHSQVGIGVTEWAGKSFSMFEVELQPYRSCGIWEIRS